MFAKLKAETLVGLLIIAGLSLIVYSSVRVTGWQVGDQDTYTVKARFDNAAGLAVGTAVRVAGIKVGTLKNIDLDAGKALVTLEIYDRYRLTRDSTVSVKSLGVLGDKYVEITMGNSPDSFLVDGDEMALVIDGSDLDSLIDTVSDILADVKSVTAALEQSVGGDTGSDRLNRILDNTEGFTRNLSETVEKTNRRIDDILLNFQQFSGDLSRITQENRQDIRAAIANIARLSEQLSSIAGENQDTIKDTLENFRQFSAELSTIARENREDIHTLTQNLASVSEDLREDTPQITENLKGLLEETRPALRNSLANLESSSQKLDYSLENIESITGKIDRGEGTVGRLINEEETVEKINETLGGLNNFLLEANRSKLDLGFSTEYLSQSARFKSYLSINYRPRRDHYYSIQLVSNPRGVDKKTKTTKSITGNTTEKTVEEKTENTKTFAISLQIVQRYYNTQLRLGLFENVFGVGADYFWGYRDQYQLLFEAQNFGREDEGTHYKAGGVWWFTRNLGLSGGVDDFLNQKSEFHNPYIGLQLSFNEDSLKLLAGSLPVSGLSN